MKLWRLCVVVLVFVVGCAHLGTLDQAVYQLTEQIVTATEQAHDQHLLTDVQFQRASLIEHDVAVAGSTFNALLAAQQASPSSAVPFLQAIRKAFRDLQAMSLAPLKVVLSKLAELDRLIANFMGAGLAATVPAGG